MSSSKWEHYLILNIMTAGLIGGMLATPNNRQRLFQTVINHGIDNASMGMDYLVSRANEEGLYCFTH